MKSATLDTNKDNLNLKIQNPAFKTSYRSLSVHNYNRHFVFSLFPTHIQFHQKKILA